MKCGIVSIKVWLFIHMMRIKFVSEAKCNHLLLFYRMFKFPQMKPIFQVLDKMRCLRKRSVVSFLGVLVIFLLFMNLYIEDTYVLVCFEYWLFYLKKSISQTRTSIVCNLTSNHDCWIALAWKKLTYVFFSIS